MSSLPFISARYAGVGCGITFGMARRFAAFRSGASTLAMTSLLRLCGSLVWRIHGTAPEPHGIAHP